MTGLDEVQTSVGDEESASVTLTDEEIETRQTRAETAPDDDDTSDPGDGSGDDAADETGDDAGDDSGDDAPAAA